MGCGQSTDGFSNRGESPFTQPLQTSKFGSAVDIYGNNNGSMKDTEEEKVATAKDITIDRSTLEEYLKIEKEIGEEELNNPLQPLELKSEQLVRLGQEISDMEINLAQLEKDTEKEKQDVDVLASADGDLRSTLLDYGNSFDDQMAKEKAEYLAALNKQEIAERELDSHRKQQQLVMEEVAELETRANHLQDLYKKHDDLLDQLFGGEYGSVMENQLEAELDELEAHRGRIMEANFKWRQAQMMLEYACKQLAVAVQKWQDLPTIPTIDLEIRYSVAAETRNNLVAAGQNINGAQRYLDNVNFPYCAPNEVETLNKREDGLEETSSSSSTTPDDDGEDTATEYVFTDMQSNERHEHAHSCYSTTHKRANALLQWFDTVINSTIMKDLHEINEKVKQKTLELRRERVRLIKEKVRELWGTDIELEATMRGQDMDTEEYSRAMLTDGQVIKLDGGELEGERANTPPPLSSAELAPMPSNSVIFGNMYDHYQNQLDSLAKQHQDEMQQFIREQESNTKRINENLQDKLMARRQRRARKKVEEAQKSALS